MGLVTPIAPVPLGELGRVHFAGIGGAGMSGIARIMLARGVPVSGCDSAASAQLDELSRLGAQVCGEPAHDPEFGVGDFCVLLDKRRADTRYLKRLRSVSAASEMAGAMTGATAAAR